ncbi:unnamed protein product [Meganyctiphanes norvegica]|uniref:C-type lectin domain-containing protein n=1 Tax=Meganyctiphanes norvegica TaxID=48144 RepID=A0AAV2QMR8_MEGNR
MSREVIILTMAFIVAATAIAPVLDVVVSPPLNNTDSLMSQTIDLLAKCLHSQAQRCPTPGTEEETHCSGNFTPVGHSCLLIGKGEIVTWAEARSFCQGHESDLVVFKDANHYAATLDLIRQTYGANEKINLWIGGSDEAQEGRWVWHTGELMQRGQPFWGSICGIGVENRERCAEPSGGRGENCAGLFHRDNHYVHDFACDINISIGANFNPICEKTAIPKCY